MVTLVPRLPEDDLRSRTKLDVCRCRAWRDRRRNLVRTVFALDPFRKGRKGWDFPFPAFPVCVRFLCCSFRLLDFRLALH